jgi:hypothetical protein
LKRVYGGKIDIARPAFCFSLLCRLLAYASRINAGYYLPRGTIKKTGFKRRTTFFVAAAALIESCSISTSKKAAVSSAAFCRVYFSFSANILFTSCGFA